MSSGDSLKAIDEQDLSRIWSKLQKGAALMVPALGQALRVEAKDGEVFNLGIVISARIDEHHQSQRWVLVRTDKFTARVPEELLLRLSDTVAFP
jgi:hypothetical protein